MPFEGSEKPSQGHTKVRQKLFQVLIDISLISLIDDQDRRRYFDNVRISSYVVGTLIYAREHKP